MGDSSLGVAPWRFVQESEEQRATASLRGYLVSGAFTGAFFEDLIDTASPDEITAKDIVAVTALGVDVPVRVSHWILSEDGRYEISALLRGVPAEATIWEDVDLSPDGNAWRLWDLISAHKGVASTITSKLLAAKRPHLLPIWDQYVVEGVRPQKRAYWAGWHQALSGRDGECLRARCEELRALAGVPDRVSILRILDIAIWMRVNGHTGLSTADSLLFADAPAFWKDAVGSDDSSGMDSARA
ncbi:MAG TPA: DUF6308 family protein [Coriobacteriia bacterium]